MNISDKIKGVFSYLKTILIGFIVFYILSVVALNVGGKAFEWFWSIFSWVSHNVGNVVFCGILQLLVLSAVLIVLFLALLLFGVGALTFGCSFNPHTKWRLK